MHARPQGERLSSLDGLRGIAAFVVLLDHCMLVVPSVIRHHWGQPAPRGSLLWFVMGTPLSLSWAGAQAVFVFFVLSGFVLTRMSESTTFAWRAYYPSRILRLYLPVFGALAFAATTVAAFTRKPVANEPWLDLWARPHLHELATDALLVRGTRLLLPPLWSLKWEMIFSILLPVAVYVAARSPRVAAMQVLILLGIASLGVDSPGGRGYLFYLPMFGIGAIMARNREALRQTGQRLGRGLGWASLFVALILTSSVWTRHLLDASVTRSSQVLGAAMLVFLCAYWGPFRRFAESPAAQWLGERSFSLYLVHFPIVITVAFVLRREAAFTFLFAIPVSLGVADLFFRGWEGPSHHLSQAVRRTLAGGRAAKARPVVIGAEDR